MNDNIKEEAMSIAQKYQDKPQIVNKMDMLRKLDESTTKMPNIVALTIGIIGTLIFGVGMCCWLVWTEHIVLGTVLGIIGAALCIINIPLRGKLVSAKKAEVTPQIIQLSNDIMEENN